MHGFRLLLLAPLAIASLAACGGGSSARLEIELAADPLPGDADDVDCLVGAASMTSFDCFSVRVQRYPERDGGTLQDVPIVRPEDDHAMPSSGTLYFPADGNPSLRFDVQLAPGADHRIEIVAYVGGMPMRRGSVERFRAGDSPIRVRLEPIDVWSCAGVRFDGAPPAERALHQAVALPNGDVLLLGGVTGDAVPATSIEVGAPLQHEVEVYDASESRFYPVEAVDRSAGGSPGYRGVFHQAFFLGTMPDGRYRVRVIGGFTASGEAAAVRFDAVQGGTYYNSPLLPGARATVRDSVDVLYDPGARRAEIVSIEPGRVPRAGFDAVAPPDPTDTMFATYTMVALGLTDGGGAAMTPRPVLGRSWYGLPFDASDAMSEMLIAGRFGATASRIGGGLVLVWGGNVDESDMPMVQARAGELIGAMTRPVAAGTDGLPPSTALHTATRFQGGVLIAGGLEVAPVAGRSGGMTTTPSTQPLTVVVGPEPAGTPVSWDPGWPVPILHAATATADGRAVVITGGAHVNPMLGTGTLWALDRVILVEPSETGGYRARALAPMIGARWGHAITPLPGNRVLVTGGFVRARAPFPMDTLRAIAAAEVLSLGPRPMPIGRCGGGPPPAADAGR